LNGSFYARQIICRHHGDLPDRSLYVSKVGAFAGSWVELFGVERALGQPQEASATTWQTHDVAREGTRADQGLRQIPIGTFCIWIPPVHPKTGEIRHALHFTVNKTSHTGPVSTAGL